jgi:nucleotide-binding universal stress UspA family protein
MERQIVGRVPGPASVERHFQEQTVIKDVQVHLDGTPQDEFRIRHAEALAEAASGIHITGIFTNPLADIAVLGPVDGGAAAAEALARLDEDARRSGDRIQHRLAERFARLVVPSEIRRIEASPGELMRRTISEARWADLFVVSRPYGGEEGARWDDLFESVLFQSGRGLYVVPPDRQPSDRIRRILVAWSDTRESVRAVAEASPLIAAAARTRIVLVDPGTGSAANAGEPGADVARHLDRLGTEVEVEVAASEGRPIGEVLQMQARRMSADLVVMGAYGHSRAREWVLGGATREMLESSEYPLLIAH